MHEVVVGIYLQSVLYVCVFISFCGLDLLGPSRELNNSFPLSTVILQVLFCSSYYQTIV